MQQGFLQFELDFFRSFFSQRGEEQPMVSPYSIGVCLSYISNLVQSDETRRQIRSAMHCPSAASNSGEVPPISFNEEIRKIQENIENVHNHKLRKSSSVYTFLNDDDMNYNRTNNPSNHRCPIKNIVGGSNNLARSDSNINICKNIINKGVRHNSESLSIKGEDNIETLFDVKIKTANILFTELLKENLGENETGYLPDVISLNSLLYDTASKIINKTVKNKTEGRITKLMNPLMRLSARNMAMSCVTLFEGMWATDLKFNLYDHKFHGFTSTFETPMLQMKDCPNVLYCEDKNSISIDLPFESFENNKNNTDGYYSFLAVMPKKKGESAFRSMVKSFDLSKFENILKTEKPKKMNIVLPKFRLETESFNLIKKLNEFGIKEKLNFASETNLAHFRQKCVFCLNTKGAIPGIEMEECAIGDNIHEQKIKVDKKSFNRPFVYFVVKHNPNIILLSGSMTMPSCEVLSDS